MSSRFTTSAVEPVGLVLDGGEELVAVLVGPVDVGLAEAARRGLDPRERRPQVVRHRLQQGAAQLVRPRPAAAARAAWAPTRRRSIAAASWATKAFSTRRSSAARSLPRTASTRSPPRRAHLVGVGRATWGPRRPTPRPARCRRPCGAAPRPSGRTRAAGGRRAPGAGRAMRSCRRGWRASTPRPRPGSPRPCAGAAAATSALTTVATTRKMARASRFSASAIVQRVQRRGEEAVDQQEPDERGGECGSEPADRGHRHHEQEEEQQDARQADVVAHRTRAPR